MIIANPQQNEISVQRSIVFRQLVGFPIHNSSATTNDVLAVEDMKSVIGKVLRL